MWSRSVDGGRDRAATAYPLHVVVLAGMGLGLILAGGLLSYTSGGLVSLGDALLNAIALCF
jgi:hypothetical protein